MQLMRREQNRLAMNSPALAKRKIRAAERLRLSGMQDRSLMRGRFVKVDVLPENDEAIDLSLIDIPLQTSALMRAVHEASMDAEANQLTDSRS